MAVPAPSPDPSPDPGKTPANGPASGPGEPAPAAAELDRALRQALIESRQRLKELLEMACDFAWETDSSGKFSFVTSNGALGHSNASLLNRDPAELTLSPEDGAHFQADSPPEGRVIWAKAADGHPVCLHLTARAIFDELGEFVCVRGACRDVTQEQERESALAGARHRERSLIKLFRALREAADPKAAIALGVETAAQATGAAGAALYAADDSGPGDLLAGFGAVPDPSGAAALAIAARGAIDHAGRTEPVLAIPGEQRGRINCVLLLARASDQPDWPEDDRFLLRELTDQLAVAVDRALEQEALARLSETDALTGLLNRRGFDANLAKAMAAARIARLDGALLYVDLDNFKQINDRHGHAQGDAALKAAAEMLRRSVRAGDLVGRLGGDEFAVWLAEVDGAEAKRRAEQLVRAARDLQRFAPGAEKPVGFSVGIARLGIERPRSDAQVMELADRAMYQVKHGAKGGVALIEIEDES
jgi:diguanylate cyclase (GGDEF)-like protein/PAS domain S-box-containing protein